MISGGAYGIDAAAHRAALAAGGATITVLASGADQPYPRGNHDLFEAITARGLLVSEWPPGTAPTRTRFARRGRVIAALGGGSVVVEAGPRSGAIDTARYARQVSRHLMAVPGPVTSAASAGCHRLIRECGAVCVTSADDVIAQITLPADTLATGRPRDRPARPNLTALARARPACPAPQHLQNLLTAGSPAVYSISCRGETACPRKPWNGSTTTL